MKQSDIPICNVPRWQQIKATLNNLSYDDFVKQSQSDRTATVLDVRTKGEFETGHMPGAINLNYLSATLADDLEKLDQSKHYYVYCRTGRRSLRICAILKNAGFPEVYNLDEGIHDRLI